MCAAFQATVARRPGATALRSADGSVQLTWRQYAERVEAIAAGLAARGVGRGDTVGLLMSNRVEFHLIDAAVFHLGATPFSIYSTSAPEQIAEIVEIAGAELVFAEAEQLGRLELAGLSLGRQLRSVAVGGAAAEPGGLTLADLERGGRGEFDFERSWREVEPGDVLTLIFTSGTTGSPKGVQLTHAGMMAQCRAMAQVLPMSAGGRTVSYLPSAHVADRWSGHYAPMVYGIEVTSVSDPRTVAAVLPGVAPTYWGSVPRILEKLKAGLEAAIAADPDAERRRRTEAAIATGIELVRARQAGTAVAAELLTRRRRAEPLLAELRERLGLAQVEWLVVGAAPLSPRVQEFLMGIGLPLTELYGISECSCCVTACSPAEARVGAVGRAIPGVEVMLAADGELLVRGPTVMAGYRGRPELTRGAIDPDGWFHTGDVAEQDADGYLRIVDRKKEIIINAAGKNMSPAAIEKRLKDSSPLIGHAVAIGDGRRYNVALLVLDPDGLATHFHGEAPAGAESDPGVLGAVAAAVGHANAKLSRVEQVKRFRLLAGDWLPGGDELTPTMKLRRRPIAEKYGAVIEELYEADPGRA